ncbi:MAG: ABC transporter substrate-binding protein [Dehalococcoidia bacterium]
MRFKRHGLRPLIYLFAIVAILSLVAACSSDDDDDGGSSGDIKTGGTLRVGMLADFSTLDPPNLLGLPDQVIVQATYDTLVFRNPDLSLSPMLATSWEANDDGTEWTFELREDVKFADGKEFTAEDVIFTFTRLFEKNSPLASVMAEPTAIVAVDDHTVRFEFAEPNAVLLESMVKYHAHVTPANLDESRVTLETFGTGPFRMTEFIVGERAVFERNPDYFGGQRPYVDNVEFIFLPDPASRAEALKAGTIDIIYDLDITSIPSLRDFPETEVLVAPSGSYMNLAMDVREPPFDNKLVRQAIQAATDRNAILQGAQFGLGGIAYDHPIAPGDPVYNDECTPPDYDPDLARDLLAQAGYPDGIKVTLYTATAGAAMVEMATVYKESAAPAGIDVTIEVTPEDGFWSDVWMQKPFTTVWWGGRPPYEAISVVYPTGAAWGESYYSNPRVDELIAQANGAGDLEEQKKIFGELQCILVDEVPRVIPVFRPVTMATRNDVKGIQPMWDGTMSLRTVWLDR